MGIYYNIYGGKEQKRGGWIGLLILYSFHVLKPTPITTFQQIHHIH